MISRLLLAAGFALTTAASARLRPTATPKPAVLEGPSLSAANKTQARKVLAAAVEKRRAKDWKPGAQKNAKPPGFQAHRCAVIYDETVTGKERVANGPFRATCSDWIFRATRDLSVQDASRPCTAAQYGPNLAGCTSWVDQWEATRGKWVEVWRQPSP